MIFKDNAVAVVQAATGYIKANRVKHINPTLIGYMQEPNQGYQDCINQKKFGHAHEGIVRVPALRARASRSNENALGTNSFKEVFSLPQT